MRDLLPQLVDTLLQFSEERSADEVAVKRMRSILENSKFFEESCFGHVGNEDDLGQQVIVEGSRGYVVARIFYDDYIEPLILRKGSDPGLSLSGKDLDCCFTNGGQQTGSNSTDTNVDDPCPDKVMFAAMSSGSPKQRRMLTDSERAIANGLAHLAAEVMEERSKTDKITRNVGDLRESNAHKELLFAHEPAGNGGSWFDWILKLSNSAVLTLQVCTDPASEPLVFRNNDDVNKRLELSYLKWGFRRTDSGQLISIFRAGTD